jgi:putative endonuclease
MTYKVYVIENPSGKLYVGLSEDVSTRLQQHNEGISKWTTGKGPWKLLWTSKTMSLSDARKLEDFAVGICLSVWASSHHQWAVYPPSTGNEIPVT